MDFPLPSIYSVDFHHYEVTVLFPPLRTIKHRKNFWKGGHRAPKTMQYVTAFPRQGLQGNLADGLSERQKQSSPNGWMMPSLQCLYRTAHLRHLTAAVCEHACSWETPNKHQRGWTDQLWNGRSYSPERLEVKKGHSTVKEDEGFMQFFSSVKRTALISVQSNHPQMLQKYSSFALITHELLE